jgi:glycerol-3-phosphate acyltransferase PlsY
MSEALAILASYLLGSVPFALIAAKVRGVDLRKHGSGNLGATNAIRVLGPGLGIPVLLADVAKGLVSVTVLPALSGGASWGLPLACGAAAIVGHVASVFLRFRGGKGVAAAAGAFLGLAPAALGIAAAAFVAVLLATRYVSLASILGAATLPVALWRLGERAELVAVGVALAALVLFRHRANLGRLAAGRESRVSFRRKERSS